MIDEIAYAVKVRTNDTCSWEWVTPLLTMAGGCWWERCLWPARGPASHFAAKWRSNGAEARLVRVRRRMKGEMHAKGWDVGRAVGRSETRCEIIDMIGNMDNV